MSSYVDKDWFYYLRGRELLLYKLLGSSGNEWSHTSGGIRTWDKELMYPNEDIADGLRIEYTRVSEPFVAEALETTTAYASGTGMSFDPGPAATISDTNDGFADTGKAFEQGDKIRVQGSSSNDGDYTLSSSGTIDEDTLTITGTFTTEAEGERITITQIPLEDSTPDATSHINLNKMLSLAVVDYCKSMLAEQNGEIDKKEYFMKEFFSKLGDNESNKRNISVSFPIGPFAIR